MSRKLCHWHRLRKQLTVCDDSPEFKKEMGHKAAALLMRAADAVPRSTLQAAEIEAWAQGLPTRS